MEDSLADDQDNLVVILNQKIKNVPSLSSKAYIFRVPRALRKVKEEAYTPQMLSIGPFHHGKERLKPMEEHKLRYLSDLFRRRVAACSLRKLVQTVRDSEKEIRECYGEIINEQTDIFVEMMVLDCCFIIELFFKYWQQDKEVIKSDPLFHVASMITGIRVDMLLLENQIPLFLLEKLFFEFSGMNILFLGGFSFLDITIRFFNFNYLLSMTHERSSSQLEGKHFLGLFRECLFPIQDGIIGLSMDKSLTECKFIPSATQLHKAGVKFKKCSTNTIMGLHFSHGELRLPTLVVEDTTETVFRNLIAFEQCSIPRREQYMTQYLALMDFLINSPQDVARLRSSGIIDNWLGDDEQVALLFNKIFAGVTIFADSFYFHKLAKDVNHHYNSPWNSFRAMLSREYFYSPWSVASSVAVIVVVVCTIIQTVCAVISTAK